MKKFLLKGILHDRGRSLLPVIVVATGAMLTVLLYSWLTGVMGESLEMSSNFMTGDVKVTTRAYAADADQFPNDLAILDSDLLVEELRKEEPAVDWVSRIRLVRLQTFRTLRERQEGRGLWQAGR